LILVIPDISPLNPLTIIPFAATILINLILEGIDDFVSIILLFTIL